MRTRRMNERETDDQTLLVPFRCAWLGRGDGRCRAAQDPPIGPGAELALELHDAPDLGPVNPHVRFYVCSNPMNGCQEVATGTPGPTWMPGAPVATFLQLPRSRPPTTPPAATSHPVASALGVLLGPDWPGRVTELGGPPGTAHVLWESLP